MVRVLFPSVSSGMRPSGARDGDAVTGGDVVAVAVDACLGSDTAGLSQLAEVLRSDVHRFVSNAHQARANR